jgi:hypothetical protein
MTAHILPDAQRCGFTTRDGKRCRSHRMEGDHRLCFFHYSQAMEKTLEPFPGPVEPEILLPQEALDTPEALNAALTRVFRLVAAGRLSTKQAAALGYLAQTILATLPPRERPAEAGTRHPVLGSDPEASLDELVRSLRPPARSSGEEGAATAHESAAAAESPGEAAHAAEGQLDGGNGRARRKPCPTVRRTDAPTSAKADGLQLPDSYANFT